MVVVLLDGGVDVKLKVRKSFRANVPARHGTRSVVFDPSADAMQFPFMVLLVELYESV